MQAGIDLEVHVDLSSVGNRRFRKMVRSIEVEEGHGHTEADRGACLPWRGVAKHEDWGINTGLPQGRCFGQDCGGQEGRPASEDRSGDAHRTMAIRIRLQDGHDRCRGDSGANGIQV
jgi:hypothetical protein